MNELTRRLHRHAIAMITGTNGGVADDCNPEGSQSIIEYGDRKVLVLTRLFRTRTAGVMDIARGCAHAVRQADDLGAMAYYVTNVDIPSVLRAAIGREPGMSRVVIIDGSDLARMAAKIGTLAALADQQDAVDLSFV